MRLGINVRWPSFLCQYNISVPVQNRMLAIRNRTLNRKILHLHVLRLYIAAFLRLRLQPVVRFRIASMRFKGAISGCDLWLRFVMRFVTATHVRDLWVRFEPAICGCDL